jgi:hypothetical protein
MRRVQLSCLFLGLLLGPVLQGRSEETPRALLTKAIEALGGEAQLGRIQAVHTKLKGVYHELDDAAFTGEVFTQLPGQFKLVLQIDVANMRLTTTQVLNRQKAWIRINEDDDPVDDATLADMQRSAYIEQVTRLFPLLRDKAYTLVPLAETKIQGASAAGIQVSSKGQPDIKLYFDNNTGLLIKTAYRRLDAMTKKEVLREEYYSDYREANPATADEQSLKAAKMADDGAALLAFLRQQTLTDAQREQLKVLIRKLADDSFEVREKAKTDLLAQGAVAVPLLSQAAQDPDPEIANRVKRCLELINKNPDTTVLSAAIRLLAVRRPAGAAEVLLAYLPSAPTEAVAQEVQGTLQAVAFRDGKADQALVQALQDKDAQRRAAAGVALGRDGKPGPQQPGQRLLLYGLKRPMKGTQYQDGKKAMAWEVTDVQFFTRFDDSLFAKP